MESKQISLFMFEASKEKVDTATFDESKEFTIARVGKFKDALGQEIEFTDEILTQIESTFKEKTESGEKLIIPNIGHTNNSIEAILGKVRKVGNVLKAKLTDLSDFTKRLINKKQLTSVSLELAKFDNGLWDIMGIALLPRGIKPAIPNDIMLKKAETDNYKYFSVTSNDNVGNILPEYKYTKEDVTKLISEETNKDEVVDSSFMTGRKKAEEDSRERIMLKQQQDEIDKLTAKLGIEAQENIKTEAFKFADQLVNDNKFLPSQRNKLIELYKQVYDKEYNPEKVMFTLGFLLGNLPSHILGKVETGSQGITFNHLTQDERMREEIKLIMKEDDVANYCDATKIYLKRQSDNLKSVGG